MSLLDRIRRLLKSPEPDHPITEQEREEHLPVTAFDVRASLEQDYVGRDLDPGRAPLGAPLAPSAHLTRRGGSTIAE